jgi:hypothetical protein
VGEWGGKPIEGKNDRLRKNPYRGIVAWSAETAGLIGKLISTLGTSNREIDELSAREAAGRIDVTLP